MDIKSHAKKILESVEEVESSKNYKRDLAKKIADIEVKYKKGLISEKQYNEFIKKHLKGKTQTEVINDYNNHILRLLNQINSNVSQIYQLFIKLDSKKTEKAPEKKVLDIKEDNKNPDVKPEEVKAFVARQRAKKTGKAPKDEYTVYKASEIGKIANSLFEELSVKLTKKYPEFFKSLFNSLKISNIRILSKTYISIMIFLTIVSFILVSILLLILLKGNLIFTILKALFLGLIASIITFALIYFYPMSIIKSKRRKIRNELPFMIIHMSAVAGSGAPPTNIFKLILESGEYKELGAEIKKIINYINLFGYNLSTSLRSVAATTSSTRFKELLNGMVSTIETGGDLKDFLNQKAEEALNTYRLERKQYTEVLSTYSDVYTGILVAAPLLFIVTLAIINVIGGKVGGMSVDLLAKIGVFGLIPFLNIAFLLFLNIVQPEE